MDELSRWNHMEVQNKCWSPRWEHDGSSSIEKGDDLYKSMDINIFKKNHSTSLLHQSTNVPWPTVTRGIITYLPKILHRGYRKSIGAFNFWLRTFQ